MLRIAIVDDHPVLRRGLRDFLDGFADLEVIAEGTSGRDAVDIARRGDVDVMLLDIVMPLQSGVDALATIRAKCRLPVLVLSGFSAAHYAAAVLRQGASGYLTKDCDPMEIVHAIRHVATGRKYITVEVAEQLTVGLHVTELETAPHLTLSERELQVFLQLAGGETVGTVAVEKSLSAKTVSTYRTRLLKKLGLKNNSQLTKYAMLRGLIH